MKKSGFLKIFAVLFAAVIFVFASGCKSTPIYLEDNAPVVVFSVISNPRIPWDADSASTTNGSDDDYDETGSGLLTNLVGKLSDKNNSEVLTAQDRVDYAAQALNDLIPITANVEVLPHEKLKESETYKKIRTSIFNYLESTMVATDYINDMQLGAKDARMIMSEIGANGIIMAEFTFQKTIVRGSTGNGEAAAKVTMRVKVLNKEGREIVAKEFSSISSDTIQISKRRYDRDQLVDLFQPAIDAVINQFLVNYIK